jgi:hypothetical protein
MLSSLNVCCGQHRSKGAKIEEVIAHDTLSGWHECISKFNLTNVMEQTLLHIDGFNIEIDQIKTVKKQSYTPKNTKFKQAKLKEIIKFYTNTAHS